MSPTRPSDCFKPNIFFWKIFGIWPSRTYAKFYKYFFATYLLITWIIFDFILTINLIYTPRTIESFVLEVIFYFNEISITAQVLMILKMRVDIFEIFEYLDCKTFKGNDDISKSYIQKSIDRYGLYYKVYLLFCHIAYVAKVVFPVIRYWITGGSLELPISKYYFLSDEIRNTYFIYWYIYQASIYGHMIYDVNIDSFIAGLMLMAITQLKVINYQLSNMKLNSEEATCTEDVQETIFIAKLKQILRHYELVLKYCAKVDDIIRMTMFVQFAMSSCVICAVLYGFLLPSSTENIVFMVFYLGAMTSEIFVPGWLGTQLSHESQLLVSSAYNSDWLPRSQSFKRSLKLFLVRAGIPIKLHFYSFHLNLESFVACLDKTTETLRVYAQERDRQTFYLLTLFNLVLLSFILTTMQVHFALWGKESAQDASSVFSMIMKTAYSCFSLLRNVQNR